jgi:vancomycin permeability regulator SanA
VSSPRSTARRRPRPLTRRRFLVALLLLLFTALMVLLGPAAWIVWRTEGDRYSDVARVPVSDAALVFGAGLLPDGQPQPLLADRIHAAVLLFQAGKVRRLLLSGDGLSPGHDEPGAMARQAEAEGVPAAALLRDPAGLHTYDTCARAHDNYGVRSAVAVSQSFHLPRAVYTCERLGIRTSGFSFARTAYGSDLWLRAREVISLDLAWWQLSLERL